jgi:hypothetical protein
MATLRLVRGEDTELRAAERTTQAAMALLEPVSQRSALPATPSSPVDTTTVTPMAANLSASVLKASMVSGETA